MRKRESNNIVVQQQKQLLFLLFAVHILIWSQRNEKWKRDQDEKKEEEEAKTITNSVDLKKTTIKKYKKMSEFCFAVYLWSTFMNDHHGDYKHRHAGEYRERECTFRLLLFFLLLLSYLLNKRLSEDTA